METVRAAQRLINERITDALTSQTTHERGKYNFRCIFIFVLPCAESFSSVSKSLIYTNVIGVSACILFTFDQYHFAMLAVLFSEAVRDMTLNLRITHKTFICEFSLFHPALDII